MGNVDNNNKFSNINWSSVVSSIATHTVAFIGGAGLIFALLASAMSQSFTVVSHGIEVICVPVGKHTD